MADPNNRYLEEREIHGYAKPGEGSSSVLDQIAKRAERAATVVAGPEGLG